MSKKVEVKELENFADHIVGAISHIETRATPKNDSKKAKRQAAAGEAFASGYKNGLAEGIYLITVAARQGIPKDLGSKESAMNLYLSMLDGAISEFLDKE